MRFLFFLLIVPLLTSASHKYYVSTTDMYYKPESNQIQLVVRVFTDDFTKALSAFASEDIKLDPDNRTHTMLEQHIASYFQTHFNLKNVPEGSTFSFVGWEYKQDQTVLYASFDALPKLIQLEWSNTFLMEVFPEQKNIVTLSTSTKKKSFLHTKDRIFAQYSF